MKIYDISSLSDEELENLFDEAEEKGREAAEDLDPIGPGKPPFNE